MGFFKDTSKKGAGYIKNEVETIVGVKALKSFTSQMIGDAQKVLNPRSVKKGKEETFSHAVERMNVNEKQLKVAYKTYFFKFYLGLALALLALLIGISMTLRESLFAIAPTTCAIAIAFSLMFDGSFRCYQINKRELCSIRQWRKNFENLLPDGFKSDEKIREEERKQRKKALSKEVMIKKDK